MFVRLVLKEEEELGSNSNYSLVYINQNLASGFSLEIIMHFCNALIFAREKNKCVIKVHYDFHGKTRRQVALFARDR